MSNWVNYKELRSRLNFESILRHYGVEIKRKGNQHHGFCPLPGHAGKRNSPSFSANLDKGIFQCFGCGAKGNLLDFAVHMEKADPKDGAAFRRVALGLQERFGASGVPEVAKAKTREQEKAQSEGYSSSALRLINPPLDFELKGLDPKHPYLRQRGFNDETVGYFKLGFCSRGIFQNRIVIPLHDQKGRLIGYAGRVVNDDMVSEENPRYRFPSKREREGSILEFRKTHFLYNGFRIQVPVDRLIVVEGFCSVWWLHQHSVPDVVAVMGSDCGERQAQVIVSLVKASGQVWIMPDGNEAGERCAESLLMQVSRYRPVRWFSLTDGRQPTDLSADEIKTVFGFEAVRP